MHIIIFYQAESVDIYSVQTQGQYFILKRIWAIDRTQHENVYGKVVSYMTYDLLVDKINFLFISSFFDAH